MKLCYDKIELVLMHYGSYNVIMQLAGNTVIKLGHLYMNPNSLMQVIH